MMNEQLNQNQKHNKRQQQTYIMHTAPYKSKKKMQQQTSGSHVSNMLKVVQRYGLRNKILTWYCNCRCNYKNSLEGKASILSAYVHS
jgi:hypothetical protein